MHKKWLIVGIAAALLVGSGIYGWIYLSDKNAHTAEETSRAQEAIVNKAKNVAMINNTADEAQNIVGRGGDINDAVAVYDEAIKSVDDAYSKSIMLLDKATFYLNDKNYDSALSIAKEAEVINSNKAVAQFVAQVYEEMGDKKNAIEYYRKAIALVDDTDPLSSDDIEYYQNKIKELGA